MPTLLVKHIDAFSSIPGKGNPAGVVVDAENYTEEQMLEIAAAVGFNETTFVLPSEVADFKLKYFTPGHEMNLCGHATMATMYALHQSNASFKKNLKIETNVGILPIDISKDEVSFQVTMQHAPPEFREFNGSRADLAHSIGISEEEIHPDLPIVYGSTGIWTLIIPISRLSSFKKMVPQSELFPSILKEMPRVSLHPICLETRDEISDMHARHFSSPFSGTKEDAVTGTASGVMGAYYVKYIDQAAPLPKQLLVEQGHEMNKDGKVYVHVSEQNDELQISITGTAVYVQDIEIII
ncbi:PhzF family phenazine biosynthesis protein [Alkalicoccobacillus porphyridii]|uniref:PhzF family phenazine biosynthesis isomerase n=1 Tax=Alkalicoccobacillus porphyridii TaxID=2597270 RepID=A0A553ZWX4_9BACI|nr:PhzF family phenazine biosynthesis isomerase [Alkalicoccobacillus porphyridii]TSB45957.1 PhzF family phenazine biosynthesis isomerase [Alkalicoccobacillus porphyridii]